MAQPFTCSLFHNLRSLMVHLAISLTLTSVVGVASAFPLHRRAPEGFVNKGLVAFGFIRSSAKDSTGDTIGGIGSAIAIKRGSFGSNNGTFFGTLVAQPDRGYNVEGTIDWQPRHHEIGFTLTPYYGTAPLSFDDAQNTLKLNYKKSVLYTERNRKKITGLDALGVRPATWLDPQLPIASNTTDRLALDPEGLVLNSDGTFWVSDEYAAYIYRFLPGGQLIHAIQPPKSALPLTGGKLLFTSETDPETGRSPNQGFEGLTVSPDGETLYAALQSATIQDGGPEKETNRYTRLFAWKVKYVIKPKLIGEWIVPLPQTKKGKSLPQSEIHYLNGKQFLILSRDGKGRGDDEHDSQSAYKGVDIFDITNATDIHGTDFDGLTPISPGGVLNTTITAATYTPFVNLIDAAQLTRFGLHNGGTSDRTLISSKWEGLALVPALDPAFPNDYFLFVAADNDFITLNGVASGNPYSSSYGEDIDSQILVYRVTLPTVPKGSVEKAIGR